MRKKIHALIVCLLLAVTLIVPPVPAKAALPDSISGTWMYTGTDLVKTAAHTWIRGNAYNKEIKGSNKNLINTSDSSYKKQYEILQQDDFLKEAQMCIIYMPYCPYSHSWLPVYKVMAEEAGAKVLLVDVTKYDTSSLIPYYEAARVGVVSPTILYKKEDGTLEGKSGVHSAVGFLEILRDCGFNVDSGKYSNMQGYDKDDWYRREVLMETNRIRIEHGLKPLSTFQAFEEAADIRAKEVPKKVSHERPNGQMFNKLIDEMEIRYPNWAGENLCCGSSLPTPTSAMIGWMNSKPHRENILSTKYTHLSIGYFGNDDLKEGSYANNWIQLFAGTCNDMSDMKITQNGEEIKEISLDAGTPISDLNLDVTFTCAAHGTSTMPLIDEMVEGYDYEKSEAGEKNLTIKYGDKKINLIANVGSFDPVELTEDMIVLSNNEADESGAAAEAASGTLEMEYDGLAKCPKVTVSNNTGDYVLMENYAYTVSYSDNVEMGKATVTVSGKGNYTGTVTKHFNIVPKRLQSDWVKGIEKTYEYTGKEITPIPSVQIGASTLLKEGRDYTVKYQDNVGEITIKKGQANSVSGTGKVIIEGIGNYQGTVTKEFGYKSNPVHDSAEALRFMLKPNPDYSSIYDLWKDVKKEVEEGRMLEIVYKANILDPAIEALNEYKAGKTTETGVITLEDIMNCPQAVGIAKDIQDFYRFLAEEKGVEVNSDVQLNTDTGISEVKLDGLDASLEQSGNAVLTVTDYADALPVNGENYDVSTQLALNIDLKINDAEVSKLEVPVTLAVKLPENYYQAGDTLEALHYLNGANEKPEKLPVIVKDGVATFVTNSFSPFVIVKKVEQYKGPQLTGDVLVNDPDVTGINFGEEDNKGPKAPAEVHVSKDANEKVTVKWEEVKDGAAFTMAGYKVSYGTDPFMEDAKETELITGTETVLPALAKGTYYITVKSIADSKATVAQIESVPSEIKMLHIGGNTGQTEPVEPTTPTEPEGPATPTEPAKPAAPASPAGPAAVGEISVVRQNKSEFVVSPEGTAALAKTDKNAKKVVIPASLEVSGKFYPVTEIKANAFKNSKKLQKVVIGKSISKIGKNAFRNCKQLKVIKIKSRELKKSSLGKNCFKNINQNVIIKVPKGKKAAYKKLFMKTGLSKKAAIR